MERNGSTDLPDADAIKMFVGQIPKGWNENDVRVHFEEYGRIYLINVLRDKTTKQSRGCCFITYYARKAALEAQNACHNLKTLPGMNHPIQMKPADNENRHERKIFVGMITKKISESDLRVMFARFGLIEECSILRDTNGISRGCGFVTFSSKACALSAIKGMHQSTIMEGCSAPLVVKMADTQKDKPTTAAVAAAAAATAAAAEQLFCQKTPYLTQLLQLLQQQVAANTALANANFNTAPQTNFASSLNAVQPANTDLTALTLLATLSAANSCMQPSSISSTPNAASSNYSSLTGFLPGNSNTSQMSTNTNSFSLGNFLQNVNTPTNTSSGALLNTASTGSQVSSGVSNQTTEGPEGSNLFIYHLPQDFVDTDLAQTFIPFGNVLSAKVFIDKTTNLSKCFGFVSFDNPLSAQLAIQAMNGFQVGPKRLKVQLKRSKDKPYWYDMY